MSVFHTKQRFLKVLDRCRNKGFTYPYQIILQLIPKQFNMEPLQLYDTEKYHGRIAVKELERDGYIQLIAGKKESYTLTAKGIEIASKNIEEMKIQHVDFVGLLAPRFDLVKKVRNDYIFGNFEDSIFKAYKLLEEKIRSKAKQPSSVFGVSLMDIAFKPKGGLLTHPRTETTSEKEGLHFLMRGAISFFKNPSSHRTVDWNDPNTSAHVIAFAKFLLDLVDECKYSG